MNIIGCLDRPTRGTYVLDGEDVSQMSKDERADIRCQKLGFVFQGFNLLSRTSALENVELPMLYLGVETAERDRRALEALAAVGLAGREQNHPNQLSGGQQQRVAVARALAHEPAVLLLDEPFGALDAKIRVELRETVRAVQQRIGMTTILVTHDQEEAFALADRMGVMQMGRLLETGSPEELYRHPTTRFVARFLGAANLFLGEVSHQGLHLGTATLAPQRATVAAMRVLPL